MEAGPGRNQGSARRVLELARMETLMKTGIILQQCFSSGEFVDMMRLTHLRHTAYARAWDMDFWAVYGDLMTHLPLYHWGGWGKIDMIRRALEQGYKYVAWIDADAAIMDMNTDLRDALKGSDALIGACKHDAPWFVNLQVPVHFNTGCMYFKNDAKTLAFVKAWADTYEVAIKDRWLEQGQFNRMIDEPEWAGVFAEIPARWNATVNVNPAADEVVRGWHGVNPTANRLVMMRAALADDWFKYKV